MKEPTINWNKEQLNLLWYWINERHRIYLRRLEGQPFPWTEDKILRRFKFTNAFRQLDRVTQAWTDRYVRLLDRGKSLSDGDLLFHCAMFRLFNWPETYDALFYGLRSTDWNFDKAVKILERRRDEDYEQIFTGAYIVPTDGTTDSKIVMICRALDFLYDGRTQEERDEGVPPNRKYFAALIKKHNSMEKAVEVLRRVPTIGGFIGYEIACDLRFTRLLADAVDVMSWANPGPGAIRGINRLLTGKPKLPKKVRKPNYVYAMRQLLRIAPRNLKKHVKSCIYPFEMREIEHSLCEFDKYMRAKRKEGRLKGVYRPPIEKVVMFDDD